MTEARRGEACCQGEGADEEDTCQLGGAHVLMLVMKVPMLHVLMMMNVIMLMLMMKVMKVKVLVKGFVVEALLLFSLSSTPTPTTNPRPAARV